MLPRKSKIDKEIQNSIEPGLGSLRAVENQAVEEQNNTRQEAFTILNELKISDEQLQIQIERLKGVLDLMEQECASTADKRRYGPKMEDRLPLKRPNEETVGVKLFLVETRGPKWTDGLVFTVMAEDHVWAEGMVRQWLDSNGHQYEDIDKVRMLLPQDLRAVVSVGAKLDA